MLVTSQNSVTTECNRPMKALHAALNSLCVTL